MNSTVGGGLCIPTGGHGGGGGFVGVALVFNRLLSGGFVGVLRWVLVEVSSGGGGRLNLLLVLV